MSCCKGIKVGLIYIVCVLVDYGCIVDDHQNASIQVPESSPGLENTMAAVVMSAFLLYNKEHTSIMNSRITTTVYRVVVTVLLVTLKLILVCYKSQNDASIL